MSEWNLTLLIPLHIIMVIPFVLCYVIGGRKWKWMRRFVGPVILFLPILLITKNLLTLIPLGILIGALTFGYGGDEFTEKLMRRLVYGLAVGGAGLVLGFISGNPVLGILQFCLAIQASVLLGITNPVVAVREEALIALLSVVFYPFML